MISSFIKKYIKNISNRKYKNVYEALFVARFLEKFAGATVMISEYRLGYRLTSKFSWVGFVAFLLWYFLYYYCTYISFAEDQTVLRHLYKTKLKHYGDFFEKIQSLLYVVFSMWKLPFDVSGNTNALQQILDIDVAIGDLGENVNYTKQAYIILVFTIVHIVASLIRVFSMWTIPANVNMDIPLERMYQTVFTEGVALLTTAHFCSFVLMLKERYKIINCVLKSIHSRQAWEYSIFARGRVPSNTHKAVQLQDKYICDKIKACAKIYSMLFKTTIIVNKLFGLAIALTMLICLNYIVLNMFHFMEGTALGLFYDMHKYVDFTFYVFWQISYALAVILLFVGFCEFTVHEAKRTSYLIHEIINKDLSAEITTEAMQMSLQLLHQIPEFTALGLYHLDNLLLLTGARSVTGFLVMLLQFVTDEH